MRRIKRKRKTLTRVLCAAKDKQHPKRGIAKKTSHRMQHNMGERLENFFKEKKPLTEKQRISSMLRSLAQHVIETGKMPDASGGA
jgi:hypothetical protein